LLGFAMESIEGMYCLVALCYKGALRRKNGKPGDTSDVLVQGFDYARLPST